MGNSKESFLQKDPRPSRLKKLIKNIRIDMFLGIIEQLNLIAIFTMFMTPGLKDLLFKLARYPLFGGAALLNIIRTSLAVRQAVLEEGANGSRERAAAEFITMLPMVTAITGGLANTPIGNFAGIIFTATLSAKSIWYGGAAIYYKGQHDLLQRQYAGFDEGSEEKAAIKKKIDNVQPKLEMNTSAGVGLTISTTATGLVMVANESGFYSIIGIATAAVTAVYVTYKLWTLPEPELTIEEIDADIDVDNERMSPNTRGVFNALSASPVGYAYDKELRIDVGHSINSAPTKVPGITINDREQEPAFGVNTTHTP